MKPVYLLACTGAALTSLIVAVSAVESGSGSEAAAPIYGVTVPEGYRHWELIAPALEAEPLDELRAVVGNKTAIAAYRAGTLPFRDGTVLVKLVDFH